MTYIPFHQSENRLCITKQQVVEEPLLRQFFDHQNSVRPGTFQFDPDNDVWWFYPPENYVMPALVEKQLHVATKYL
jgi:hypothetical protein